MALHLTPDRNGLLAGFTLVESLIVVVVLGVISAYAVMKNASPAIATLPSQAEAMASDIRHAQALAFTSGSRMRVALNGNAYEIRTCSNATTCNTLNYSVSLENGVTFTSGTATLDFDTLGQPGAGASYTLAYGGYSKTVAVATVTGRVTVASP